VLQDLGASNGSYVNGRQIQSCRLGDSDRLQLGDAEFEFKLIR